MTNFSDFLIEDARRTVSVAVAQSRINQHSIRIEEFKRAGFIPDYIKTPKINNIVDIVT